MAMKKKAKANGGKRMMKSKGGAMGGKRKMMSKGGMAGGAMGGGKTVRGPNS